MSIVAKQITIDDIFGNEKFNIDFYQREYKWEKEDVLKLLEDIFYKFENEYKEDIDITVESINSYSWYYLSAYMTNNFAGKIYIVDGQQRFTTITLILISLYHLARLYNLEERCEWIKNKIYGTGIEGKSYWMGDYKRNKAFEDLFIDNKKSSMNRQEDDLSINNIYQNYVYVNEYLTDKLCSKHKFEAFLLFFLKRIILVNIEIEDSKDVSMVFEVINDRGKRLKPYEVFKGQLLGQLDKNEINSYYNIWYKNIAELQKIDEKEVDNFFRYYFRAKFVDTRSDSKNFDGDYNKTVFSNKWASKLNLKNNPTEVKRFLKEDFNFYCNLYYNLITKLSNDVKSHVFFNSINNQDRQYMLIMSAIEKDDDNLAEKIEVVSKMFDRYFTLLQLLGCYDSNNFNDSITKLNTNIRNKSISDIEKIFNDQLISDINSIKNINISNPFQWSLFKEANNSLGVTFLRCFFARIDNFIAENAQLEQFDKYYNLIRNTGSVNGYHIEHILADNDENKKIFDNNEELFYTQRNYLGALLLLKGKDNQSSGKETYENKLKTYSHETLWAQTLTENFYHCNPGIKDLMNKYNLNLHPINYFDQQAIEIRQRLLFELVKIIWK